jgi:hypothetical protein
MSGSGFIKMTIFEQTEPNLHHRRLKNLLGIFSLVKKVSSRLQSHLEKNAASTYKTASMRNLLVLLATSLLLCQCNSTQYTGSAPNPPLTKLAIVKNTKLHMSGMQPEVVKQVQEMGIATILVDAPPVTNEPYLTFTANWAWDLAMYLRYFKAELHQGGQVTGSVEYKTSGSDMSKFGHTDAKIRPMLRKLILGENPPPKPRAPAASMR